MTQLDPTARRKQIAEEMASFSAKYRRAIMGEVALKYCVGVYTVQLACKEHFVQIPRMRAGYVRA